MIDACLSGAAVIDAARRLVTEVSAEARPTVAQDRMVSSRGEAGPEEAERGRGEAAYDRRVEAPNCVPSLHRRWVVAGEVDDVSIRSRPSSRRVAACVTEVTAPTVLAVALLLVIGARSTRPAWEGMAWAAAAALFCAGLPRLILAWGVRRRLWNDRHVRVRRQRLKPLAATALCVFTGLALLAGAEGAPRRLVALVVTMQLSVVAFLLLSLIWKVSLHTSVAAGSTVVLTASVGPAGLWFAAVVPLTAWSRVRLGDHTLAQAIAGTAIGVVLATPYLLLT
ncbi:hypothetical protein SMC26_15775 [Actinomadura fulvescens]|uniref:Phosphatidic acid phosphatase type 2/haloperoxidase domain-containing protein n=1 Tax=Actinomadura fulvescens TaxID=46160 RepID=A0ABP6D8V7_9ACTN